MCPLGVKGLMMYQKRLSIVSKRNGVQLGRLEIQCQNYGQKKILTGKYCHIVWIYLTWQKLLQLMKANPNLFLTELCTENYIQWTYGAGCIKRRHCSQYYKVAHLQVCSMVQQIQIAFFRLMQAQAAKWSFQCAAYRRCSSTGNSSVMI